jgi:L-ascorbate metabolism protein UlaG (beta-lactamase superfamily)
MRITMIGHSTVLVETGGQRILTDPYFSPHGNPAYHRISPPSENREVFLDIDMVLLSHNHWDHVDSRFFRQLSPTVPIYCPRLAVGLARIQGVQNAVGLNAWQSCELGTVKITAVPAVHITFTIGFVIQSEGKQIYFAGDTYYSPFMREIGSSFHLDAALIPVTTYIPPMTMGEQDALHATRDLSPQVIIPIHLGITPRSPFLRTRQTPERFNDELRKAGLDTRLVILKEGESWDC